jgi:hypothetical protein
MWGKSGGKLVRQFATLTKIESEFNHGYYRVYPVARHQLPDLRRQNQNADHAEGDFAPA